MPRSVFAAMFLSAFILFFNIRGISLAKEVCFGLWSSVFGSCWFRLFGSSWTKDQSPKTQVHRPKSNLCMCDAEQQRPLTVNQADLNVLRRCESYHMHQSHFRLPIGGLHGETKNKAQRTKFQSAIKNFWRGSLTGKAVVLKTTALVACRFESCPFRQSIADFQLPIADWNSFRIAKFGVQSLFQSAIGNWKSKISGTCSSAE